MPIVESWSHDFILNKYETQQNNLNKLNTVKIKDKKKITLDFSRKKSIC